MNKARRKQLAALVGRAEVIKDELDGILSAEQESFDNMPENLQSSMRAMESEEAIGQMEEAMELLSDAIDAIGAIT